MPRASEEIVSNLDRSSSVALIYEVYAVKALLDAAEMDLERVRVLDDDLHPWLAVAAMGTERFVKLVLGFARLDQHGTWPGPEIRNAGHKIVQTEATCRAILSAQVSRATHPKYIRQLLADVDADPWLVPLLGVLESFADEGRYEHLDGVAGRAPKNTPKAKFETLEQDIAKTRTTFPSTPDEHLAHRNPTLRASLRRWRNLYAYAMAHNVIGVEGMRFGLEFRVP